MEKGKLGVKLSTWPVIAFVLALFGQTLLCGLLLAFVLIVEKDEKVSRQCMTAFFLSLVWMALLVLSGCMLLFSGIISELFYYSTGAAIVGLSVLVIAILAIVMLVFTIIGLANVCKGREAGVPILSGLAERAFGFVRPRPQPQYPPQGYYPPGAPGQQAPGQSFPVQPQYPQPGPQAPAAPPQPYAQGGQPPYGGRPAGGPPPPPPPPIAHPDDNASKGPGGDNK